MARVKLNRGWEQKVQALPAVRRGSERLGKKIAADAQQRTAVGATGRARRSVQVIERDGEVYVVGGTGAGWYFIFQELGGSGFRPPPMPIRRAASKYRRIPNR